MEIMKCKVCLKEFEYQVTSMNVPGGNDREYIYCPYCGEENGSYITSGFVVTSHIEIAFFLTVFGVDCGAPKVAVLTLIWALENLSRNSLARVV